MTELHADLSNEQLVDRFQTGDTAVFSLLVERMLPMLRQETASTRCNQADGDDLAQEALLALLSAAQHFRADGGAAFATYARVCVHNRLLSAAVSFSSPEMPQEDTSLYGELEKNGQSVPDPGEWLQKKEDEKLFLQRLKTQLSDLEYRVLLCHLAAYSYSETAALLGVETKAVDNALQRIRKKLSSLA